jgi:8-oxo-dGTP pyrophosphatase MutT (NUDIX family)
MVLILRSALSNLHSLMPIPEFVQHLRKKIGHDLILLPSVDAIVFNDAGEVLLHRRADSGKWSLISGIMEPGEEPAAAVVREVFEETGITAVPERIIWVNTTPVIHYPNGDQAQYVVTCFVCRANAGEPHVHDDESLEVRYFPIARVPELRDDHQQKLNWALRGSGAFFRPV